MRLIPLNLILYITSKQPQIPNYHTIVQNNHENKIPGDSIQTHLVRFKELTELGITSLTHKYSNSRHHGRTQNSKSSQL